MPTGDRQSRRAYAKINLGLRVGAPIDRGARAGMHPIVSWIHAIELADELRVERAARTRHDIAWDSGEPVSWDPRTDLVVRAHAALEARAGRALPAAITVRKSIPDGAGLGGGSSDAASVLTAIRACCGLEIGADELGAIGHTLGSDVPFFLDDESPPRPALVGGVGETIERLDRRDGALTLVVPGFGCATGAVYRAFDELGGASAAPAPIDPAPGGAIPWDALVNDLTDAARRVEPRLGGLIDDLGAALGLPVVTTGSGSALMVPGHPEVPRDIPGVARVIPTRLV